MEEKVVEITSCKEFAAAGEIRRFRRMFQTVFELGELLENDASLRQSVEEHGRKIAASKEAGEAVLAELRGKIASAEEKLSHLTSQAVADHEAAVSTMKGERGAILSGIEAEIQTARGELEETTEALRTTKEQLTKREEELFTVENRMRQLRTKFIE